jgi:hypothetical protein
LTATDAVDPDADITADGGTSTFDAGKYEFGDKDDDGDEEVVSLSIVSMTPSRVSTVMEAKVLFSSLFSSSSV